MKPGKLDVYGVYGAYGKGDFRWKWLILLGHERFVTSTREYDSKWKARTAARVAAKALGIDLENTTAIKPR